MDWMYLFYFLLAALICFGAKYAGRGAWNEEYTSLKQTKALQGITALGIALHHMAQKTCAPWHPRTYTVHGLDPFLSIGYMFVGVFLFCSGLGLYRSLKSKPDYLKGFIRRRILPIVIAFYLSEIIYTAIRLAMGERMDFLKILWYLSGLHMANFNAWYVIVIPFFYLAFWAAFRFCKREGTAICWVFAFTLAYTALGASIDHQNDWWMRGEWWYNSIILFPLGLLFGKFERQVTAFFRKGYFFWLALSFAAVFLLFWQSEWMNEHAWGYYDFWSNPMKIPHRLMSAGLQWLAAFAYVAFCFLLMMKVKLGNAALAWLGSVTLSFYLMHGIFVELFGYNFLDISKSLVYIKNLPLYIAVVLACSVLAAALFDLVWRKLVSLILGGKNKREPDLPGVSRGKARRKSWLMSILKPEKERRFRRFIGPGIAVLLLAGFMLPILPGGDEHVRVMNGQRFQLPDNYTKSYSDSRYAVWKYAGNDRKPGNLILDANIQDTNARSYSTVDDVLAECTWMTDVEVYVNPQGVRMVRGYAHYAEGLERRYYIEGAGAPVLLMCMNEDERFYSPDDCEEMLRQVAENVRPAK